jgi:hypothetical protein
VILLPITFENIWNPATILATPDTGADVNVISSDLAKELGFDIRTAVRMDLRLPNGKKVESHRIVTAIGRFAISAAGYSDTLICNFRVAQKMVSPLILCRDFLQQTQTMTLHSERLLKRPCSYLQIPRVRALGDVQERFHCSLDGENVKALADTGSDVDLISLQYAAKRGFQIEPKQNWLMFADGSVVPTQGTFRAQLAAGFGATRLPIAPVLPTVAALSSEKSTTSSQTPSEHLEPPDIEVEDGQSVIETEFHVVKDLRLDAIVGMASLESLAVYTQHAECLVDQSPEDEEHVELNRIMLIPDIIKRYKEITQTWRTRNREARSPIR